MALQMDFADKTGGVQQDAYILADLTLDNKEKNGRLELAVWRNASARANRRKKINNVPIPVDATETLDDSGNVLSLAWADVAWKTGAELYTKIKTLKVLADGVSYDMSGATDC